MTVLVARRKIAQCLELFTKCQVPSLRLLSPAHQHHLLLILSPMGCFFHPFQNPFGVHGGSTITVFSTQLPSFGRC